MPIVDIVIFWSMLIIPWAIGLYMEWYATKMQQLEDEVPSKGKRLILSSTGGQEPVAVPTQTYQIEHY